MAIRQASVIICSRNRAALLPRLIDQLRAQDYPKDAFEIIVVDNNSTDNTQLVVESLAAGLGVSVKYVAETRPGVTFARNRGAEDARYPYLAYLDDDNSIGPDWLSQLVQGFDLHDDVAVVAGRVENDYDDQRIPSWFGPKIGVWLAEFNFPGSQPLLLDNPGYISEGNIAITRQSWKESGGFLGMDQFGSPHEASNESIYMLEQIKRKGGKIAFVPKAIAYHHKLIPTKQQILRRAYWNGVSTGVLEHILYRRTWSTLTYNVFLNGSATFTFIAFSFFSLIRFDEAGAMYHFLRAIRRIGLLLSELRLVGDWQRVRSWMSSQS